MTPFWLAPMMADRGTLGTLTRTVIKTGERDPLADLFQEGEVRVLTFEVGEAVFVETLTKYYTGRVLSFTPTELVLADAAWVDDTGRLNEFLRTGKASGLSVEPYIDPVHVPAHMITNKTAWRHKLFREVI